MFTQRASDPGGAAAARKVFQPRRAHPQLIVPVADYLEERFAAAASAKGTV
jgi:hypothetical protein